MQTYKRIELIVVDDKSQEFDIKSVDSYISERKDSNLINFVVYQNPVNYGTVKSINCALKKVKGKYVKLLAADDALYSKEVLVQAEKALQSSKNGIITSDIMKCDSALIQISIYHKPFQKKIDQFTSREYFRRLCMRNGIVAGGVFFTAEFFEKFGFFDERYRLLEDWPTWLRLAKQGIRIEYHPFITLRYRANSGIGTSTNQQLLNDKFRVLESIIIPSKKDLGLFFYILTRVSFFLTTSLFIRKLFAIFYRSDN
jgi:glycosyltransferase involved in cell wall biosynthesis